MDTNGSLATLRHGFKCYGRTLHVAFFKAAHELNPELEARYAANRLGLTRQLALLAALGEVARRHAQPERHPGRHARAEEPAHGPDGRRRARQYQQDRDPREPIFEFKRRTLVHFAVDTEAVLMTTRLAGRRRTSCPSTRAATAAPATRPTRQGGPIARPTCGRRCCSGTACSTSWRASSTCRSRRSATIRAARSRRRR